MGKRSTSRRSVASIRPALPVDFSEAVAAWRSDGLARLMSYVWRGCDDLLQNPAPDVDWNNEWSLNAHLARRIRRLWPRASPFEFEPSWPLLEKRVSRQSQPPTPDFSILSRDNRVALGFDFDGKVIRRDDDTSAYAEKVTKSFLTGRYSAKSNGGGMIAYLAPGDEKAFAVNIAAALGCTLALWKPLAPRLHFFSGHRRTLQSSQSAFVLHHLLMALYRKPTGR